MENEVQDTGAALYHLVEGSGLEKSKQNQIAETLGAFFNKAAEWDSTIQSIVITSPEETGKMKMAREGRLTLRSMRLNAKETVDEKRKEVQAAMANYTLEDKLWLKAWQMIEATFKNLETRLEEKEKFAERWEAEQKEKLRLERASELEPLGFQSAGVDLGGMDEETYKSLKLGLETAKKMAEAVARQAEEDRIAKEKADAEERERVRLENERLKAENEAKEQQLAEERAKAAEAERQAQKQREEAEAKLRAEREENERLQAEIRAKQEAEERAKKEAEDRAEAERKAKELAEKKAANAPDKEKLLIFATQVEEMSLPDLNSEEAQKILLQAAVLLTKTANFIREKSNEI